MAKAKKKKSSPGIAKNRKTKEQARRSLAAKKGWKTRRINFIADAKAALAAIGKKKRSSKKPAKKPTRKTKRPTRKQLEQALADAQKKLAEKWVPAAEDEWLRSDGALALHPSRLRHTKVGRELFSEMKRLERKSQVDLRDYIRFWAHELDTPVQEFYTLLMSP